MKKLLFPLLVIGLMFLMSCSTSTCSSTCTKGSSCKSKTCETGCKKSCCSSEQKKECGKDCKKSCCAK